MEEIDYRYFDDNGFTIKLVGPPHTIDVDTLIDTLRGFADALKEINSVVNPKYELEVLIDEAAPGSIQIIIRLKKHFKKHKTKYIAAGLAGHLAYDVVAGVFGNYMYDQLKADKVCETEHHPDYVIVKGDGCNQRISFQAYQFRQAVADNPKVAASVSKAIKAADKDKSVDGVSIQASPSRNEAATSRARSLSFWRRHCPPNISRCSSQWRCSTVPPRFRKSPAAFVPRSCALT